MTIEAKITFNKKEIAQEIQSKSEKIQPAFDSLVLADSNFFCPIKTGKLKDSAIINTKIGSGFVVWQTPYARKLYYTYTRPPYQPNPNATAKWFESAKARYSQKWEAFVNERFKRS